MHCEQAQTLLTRLALGEVEPGSAEHDQIQVHVADCSACHEKLGDLRLTMNHLKHGVETTEAPRLSADRLARLQALSQPAATARPQSSPQPTPAQPPVLLQLFARRLGIAACIGLLCIALWGVIDTPRERSRDGNVRGIVADATPRPSGDYDKKGRGEELDTRGRELRWNDDPLARGSVPDATRPWSQEGTIVGRSESMRKDSLIRLGRQVHGNDVPPPVNPTTADRVTGEVAAEIQEKLKEDLGLARNGAGHFNLPAAAAAGSGPARTGEPLAAHDLDKQGRGKDRGLYAWADLPKTRSRFGDRSLLEAERDERGREGTTWRATGGTEVAGSGTRRPLPGGGAGGGGKNSSQQKLEELSRRTRLADYTTTPAEVPEASEPPAIRTALPGQSGQTPGRRSKDGKSGTVNGTRTYALGDRLPEPWYETPSGSTDGRKTASAGEPPDNVPGDKRRLPPLRPDDDSYYHYDNGRSNTKVAVGPGYDKNDDIGAHADPKPASQPAPSTTSESAEAEGEPKIPAPDRQPVPADPSAPAKPDKADEPADDGKLHHQLADGADLSKYRSDIESRLRRLSRNEAGGEFEDRFKTSGPEEGRDVGGEADLAAVRQQLDLLNRLNREQLAKAEADPALEARLHKYELATRMQRTDQKQAENKKTYEKDASEITRVVQDEEEHARTLRSLAGKKELSRPEQERLRTLVTSGVVLNLEPAEKAQLQKLLESNSESSVASKADPSASTPTTRFSTVKNDKDDGDLPPAANYPAQPVNPFVLAQADRFSTFALDVDTASYTLARKYIERGYRPPQGSVRMEEFVNNFDYNYSNQGRRTFTVNAQAAPAPFGDNLTLLKVGVKARTVGREGRKAAHVVLVVDASGSMDKADRLPLVQKSLKMLSSQLHPQDRVSLVTYGNRAQLVLEAMPASHRAEIGQAIAAIQPGGSTNMLDALELGYQQARAHFRAGYINRVILCSDGVANIGPTDATAILKRVEHQRRQGITLTTVGFGIGAYNDQLMEQLANRGDGTYAFVDTPTEARRLFVEQLAATLQTVARDAKIQVEFNPHRVRRYRLVGYENRDIADKDFRNDQVDAGEIGSGQSSTALYEVELLDSEDDQARPADLGTVYVRYRDADTHEVKEIAQRLSSELVQNRTPSSDPRFFLAAAAAELAEILRGSPHARSGDLEKVQSILVEVLRQLPLDQQVAEVLELVSKVRGLPQAP